MFQRVSESGFPRVTGDFGWGFDSGPRVDEHLGQLIAQHLTDPRGTNSRLPLADLLRQSVYTGGRKEGGTARCLRNRLQ
jgi:hypothetical protein